MKFFKIPKPAVFSEFYCCPRGELIVTEGLLANNQTFVDNPDEADWLILDYVPSVGTEKYNYKFVEMYVLGNEKRTIILDWRDEIDLYQLDCAHYFKRSYVTTEKLGPKRFVDYARNVHHISYAVLNGFLGENKPYKDRCYGISCTLREQEYSRALLKYWLKSFCLVSPLNKTQNILGQVNTSSRSVGTEPYFDGWYFKVLRNSKITVTCDPLSWRDCSRPYEAFAAESLVFSDELYHTENPFIHKKHFIKFDWQNPEQLFKDLVYFTENQEEAAHIAKQGYEFALEHHSSKARMKHVLEILNGQKKL